MKACNDCQLLKCNWNNPDHVDKKFCPLLNITGWAPLNVYKSADIGKNVSIARFVEIGDNVKIGQDTRIGKGAFIPEGVTIGENVFIGPHVCFSNDMYPVNNQKMGKEEWLLKTNVEHGASIGANVSIRPGVRIGRGAMIGMGAVVTKDVPEGETWAGCPAKNIEDRKA